MRITNITLEMITVICFLIFICYESATMQKTVYKVSGVWSLSTVVADVQHMAAALAEAAIDGRLVGIQQIHRHKRLDGTRKSALQAPGAAAVQHFLAQGQGQGHALLLRGLDAVRVLVELKAGMAALDDEFEEGIKIIIAHGVADIKNSMTNTSRTNFPLFILNGRNNDDFSIKIVLQIICSFLSEPKV